MDTPSNVTNVRFKIAIISGDISELIGSAGQSFCADLPIYAAIADQTPRESEDSGTGNLFCRCIISNGILIHH